MAYYLTRLSCGRYFRRMPVFANTGATSKPLKLGPRSKPHRTWWKDFLRDSGGAGFWHETYFMRGGVEAVFDDMPKPIGLMRFAPNRAAKGGMFTARQRAAATNAASFGDRPAPAPVVTEREASGDD
jgi:hypothetical protein